MSWSTKRGWIEIAATALAVVATATGSQASLIVAGEVGNARASATNLDAFFDLALDSNIFDSTTVAHASVSSTNGAADDVDWYAFTGVAGASIFLDIDCGSACGVSVDATLALFDDTGTVLAFGDDSDLDPGTANIQDAFVGTFVLPASGTYYAAVSNFNRFPVAIYSCGSYAGLTRPDASPLGGFGGFGCTPGDDSFSGGGFTVGDYVLHVSNSQVPEPSPLALIGLGLVTLALRRRIRRPTLL
jgi:hypothetical protein